MLVQFVLLCLLIIIKLNIYILTCGSDIYIFQGMFFILLYKILIIFYVWSISTVGII